MYSDDADPHHTGYPQAGQESAVGRKMVRMGRLELPRVAPLEPKSSAYTNFATFAVRGPHRNDDARQNYPGFEARTKEKTRRASVGSRDGGPWRGRTSDLLIKSQLLYQLS